MTNRTCQTCGGALPNRKHRQRNSEGKLVCDGCKSLDSWKTAGIMDYFDVIVRQATDEAGISEYGTTDLAEACSMADQIWEDEDPTSVFVMNRGNGTIFWHNGANTNTGRFVQAMSMLNVVAHDSGDNAIINHCPFCGAGALTARSDGTAVCDFCHTSFTVQVQPQYPNAPQTVDGTPTPVPGMPGDTPTEMSAPVDPAVPDQSGPSHETDIVPEKGLAPGDAKQPEDTPGQAPAKPKGNLPPWLKDKKSSRTASSSTGESLLFEDPQGQWWWEYHDEEYEDGPVTGGGPFPTSEAAWKASTFMYSPSAQTLFPHGSTDMFGGDLWEYRTPPWERYKTSMLVTAQGVALDEDTFVQHLAIKHADEPGQVLAAVRAENGS